MNADKAAILNVFKPVGWSSAQVVGYFKKNLPGPVKKIGHFGTLDPFACGVLLIGFNGAARFNDLVHETFSKTYLATGELGVKSNTGDKTGELEKREIPSSLSALSEKDLQKIFQEKFVGKYWQSPPAYSAVKHQGRKLYQWALKGVTIEKEKKQKEIFSLEVVRFIYPKIIFRVTVNTGTYIRTLFEDMAELLGTAGTLHSLVRESIGPLSFKNSLYQKDWPTKDQPWDRSNYVQEPQNIFSFPSIVLSPIEAQRYRQGIRPVFQDSWRQESKMYWVANQQGDILGLGEEGVFQDQRCLNQKINLYGST